MNRRMLRPLIHYVGMMSLCSCALLPTLASFAADATSDNDARWWPVQAVPKALVRLEQNDFPSPRGSYEMMAQSVAGLAAKAVNEGRGDEMVWIGSGNANLEEWLDRLLVRHPDLEMRGVVGLWDLIDRYAKKGIIKGYILYKSDDSKGEYNQHRSGMDCSVNVATSLAGIVDGIIVDEKLEPEAKAHGLTTADRCTRQDSGMVLRELQRSVQPSIWSVPRIRESHTSAIWPLRKRRLSCTAMTNHSSSHEVARTALTNSRLEWW